VIAVLVRAVLWSTLFVGVVLMFVPAWILAAAGIRAHSFGGWQVAGLALGLIGTALAVTCIAAFAFVGRGTPAPFDPPQRLVVRGPYRLNRNPMYAGAWLLIAGLALFYRSGGMAVYAFVFLVIAHGFVVLYEEPTLRRMFGRQYLDYCQTTGRWWPRGRRGGRP
jgi:protein-S-isoprenylcysteine O-methyltransferase Ste14